MKRNLSVNFIDLDKLYSNNDAKKRIINLEHIYCCNSHTKFIDFYKWCHSLFWANEFELADDYYIEHYCICSESGELFHPRCDIKVCKYMRIHNIKKLVVGCMCCHNGGAGGLIQNIGMIRINPKEHGVPHLHLYKGRYSNNDSVRISLKDLEPLFMDKSKYKKFFNKSEREKLNLLLHRYQSDFINFYYEVQRGENPRPLLIESDGKETWIK